GGGVWFDVAAVHATVGRAGGNRPPGARMQSLFRPYLPFRPLQLPARPASAAGVECAATPGRRPAGRPAAAGALSARSADQDLVAGRRRAYLAGIDRCATGDSRHPVRLGGRGRLLRDSRLASGGGSGDSGGYPPLAKEPLADTAVRRMAVLQGASGGNPLRPGDRCPGPAEKRLADPLRQGAGGRPGPRLGTRAVGLALL